MDGDQTDQERMVTENVTPIGTDPANALVRPVGVPVVAMDFITLEHRSANAGGTDVYTGWA